MAVMERLLETPLGAHPLQEFTETRVELRWAMHWRDEAVENTRLIEWKLRMLEATDNFITV